MQPSDDDRGPVVPIAPDPERDARVDAYRDRERRRAARALDRYIEITFGPDHELREPWAVWGAAGERFVEAVGDYVLARLTDEAVGAYVAQRQDLLDLPCGAPGPCYLKNCARDASGACVLQQKADYGVTPIDHGEALSKWHAANPGVAEMAAHPAPDHSATQAALAWVTMPHPTCQDVSAFNEPLGTRWACTDRCPR